MRQGHNIWPPNVTHKMVWAHSLHQSWSSFQYTEQLSLHSFLRNLWGCGRWWQLNIQIWGQLIESYGRRSRSHFIFGIWPHSRGRAGCWCFRFLRPWRGCWWLDGEWGTRVGEDDVGKVVFVIGGVVVGVEGGAGPTSLPDLQRQDVLFDLLPLCRAVCTCA